MDQQAIESSEANQPEATPRRPTPLSEQFVTTNSIPAALRKRLQEALGQVVRHGAELTLLARVAPIAVRAAEPSTVTAARLELPEEVSNLLGSAVETRVLADGQRLRIWLAGAERIKPDSTVTLIAIDASGELVEANATGVASHTAIELSVSWDGTRMPEAVALVFKNLS